MKKQIARLIFLAPMCMSLFACSKQQEQQESEKPFEQNMEATLEAERDYHSYAVDLESLKNTKLKATHINLLDNTVEGVECVEDMVFSVQYHPESAPGPQDSSYLFEKFTSILQANMDAKSDPDAARLGKAVKKESEVRDNA